MTTIEELKAKRKSVEVLRLRVDELRYMRELSMFEQNTHIDENGSASDKDRAIKEFHAKIVELHTEIQELQDANDKIACEGGFDILIKEKDARIKELRTELSVLKRTLGVVEELVSMAGKADAITLGALFAIMGSISEVLQAKRKYDREHTTGQGDIPDVIKGKVKELEESLNEDLPEGMSVSVLPYRVSSTQMSEMLKIVEED